MAPYEYAVHYSIFPAASELGPYCRVFDSLAAAVAYAQQQVQEHPALRCTIYDSRGFGRPPLHDIRGSEHKEKGEMTPRFRRWVGSILFVGGLILTIIDWRADFALLWPAMIGMRILFPGLALLVIELVININRRKKRAAAQESS